MLAETESVLKRNKEKKELTLTLHTNNSPTKVHPDASFGTPLESTVLEMSLLQCVLMV